MVTGFTLQWQIKSWIVPTLESIPSICVHNSKVKLKISYGTMHEVGWPSCPTSGFTKLWKGPNWSMYFPTILRSRGVRCDNWTLYSSVFNRGRLHLQLCAIDVESFLVMSCISWGFWLANVSLCLEVRLPPLGLVRNYVADVIKECHLVISKYTTSQKLRHTFYI